LAASAEVFAPAIAQNKPVRIGILAPRSGIAAAPGENGIRATQWAVERFNAGGGIAGRKVELVIEEESSPKDTIERFGKLVQQEKVDCVQGIISTGAGLALGPVVEEARALTIDHKVVTEQWPKVGTMDLTSHVAALKSAKPDLIFSSLLFADLPVFMKQAHAAELTKDSKLVFPAAGWQHTLMKKEFTPEGIL